jgi:nucleotide-binding universal stress UspA family protein
VIDTLHSAADALLQKARDQAAKAGVEAEVELIETTLSSVGACIVAAAAASRAELIVCGTHGRRGIGRALMGSDAEHVARHASVPVLLVRRSEAG